MKVIVAIDQSPYWTQVIEGAIRKRWSPDTCFKILTTLEPAPWDQLHLADTERSLENLHKMRRQLALSILSQARQILIQGVVDCTVHTELKEGFAHDEIIRAATEFMADKIVLGAHGHSPNRLLPGKVSRSVAQRASCSIELVRLKTLSDMHVITKTTDHSVVTT